MRTPDRGLMALMVLYLIYTGIYISRIKLTFRKKQVHEQQLARYINKKFKYIYPRTLIMAP